MFSLQVQPGSREYRAHFWRKTGGQWVEEEREGTAKLSGRGVRPSWGREVRLWPLGETWEQRWVTAGRALWRPPQKSEKS